MSREGMKGERRKMTKWMRERNVLRESVKEGT